MHEHGAVWPPICGALEKKLLTSAAIYLAVIFTLKIISCEWMPMLDNFISINPLSQVVHSKSPSIVWWSKRHASSLIMGSCHMTKEMDPSCSDSDDLLPLWNEFVAKFLKMLELSGKNSRRLKLPTNQWCRSKHLQSLNCELQSLTIILTDNIAFV